MAILGSAILEQGVAFVKDKEVSIGALIVCVGILFVTWQFADSWFIPRAEAEENVKTVQQAVSRVEVKIDDHVKEWRNRSAVEAVEKLETELWHLEEHIALTGESSAATERKRYLSLKLEHAEEYKTCVLHDRPNCEHLRDNR